MMLFRKNNTVIKREAPSILIFCPDISGHRHLYCRGLIKYCQDRGVRCVLAAAGKIDWVRGKFGKLTRIYGSFDDHEANKIKNMPGVQFIDILADLKGNNSPLLLASKIAGQTGVSDIIHLDADSYRWDFAFRLHANKLARYRNHLVVICAEFDEIAKYCVDIKKEASWLFKTLLYRAVMDFKDRGLSCMLPRITNIAVKLVLANPSVTSIIYFDEKKDEYFGEKGCYVPELSIRFLEEEKSGILPEEHEKRILSQVKSFISQNENKEPICLFGDLENRKDFNLLLRLCARDNSTICIRIGRTKPGYHTTWGNVMDKETLIKEGRLLEVDSYVNYKMFEHIMEHCRLMILPYLNFFRHSSSFYDIILSGIPIIVPNRGWLGYKTSTYKLGETFENGNIDSLRNAFHLVRKKPFAYDKGIKEVSAKLQKGRIYKRLDNLLGIENHV
jgi:hypothetical protein